MHHFFDVDGIQNPKVSAFDLVVSAGLVFVAAWYVQIFEGTKMNIKSLTISNLHGYVLCKSNFYQAHDVCHSQNYEFINGLNVLKGEIDSGIWGISYYLSMSSCMKSDFVLFDPIEIQINHKTATIDEVLQYSVYMDSLYPLFSNKKSINELIDNELKKRNKSETPEYIRDLFHIDSERFLRPINQVGNERFRAMAAIAYCHDKDIFCFPWLSKSKFESYHNHMSDLFDILTSLNKVIILPVSKETIVAAK